MLKRRKQKPKLKRPDKKEEVKENKKLKLKRRGENPPQEKKEGKLKRRLKEEPLVVKKSLSKLKRRKNGIIYCSEDEIICYVCGKEIGQEFVYESKKIFEEDKKGRKIQKTIRVPYPIPPLAIGKNEEGIVLYRHRDKKCAPMSSKYMEKLKDYVHPSLLTAYIKGKREVRPKTFNIDYDEDEDE